MKEQKQEKRRSLLCCRPSAETSAPWSCCCWVTITAASVIGEVDMRYPELASNIRRL